MWWLIPVAVSGAAYLLLQALKDNAQAEYKRWDSARLRVQGELRRHRQAIAEHIESAQRCFDFHSLCELYFASVKLADGAYRLLDDAKAQKAGTYKAIRDIKAKMEGVYGQTKALGLNKLDREKLHSHLAELKQSKELLAGLADAASKQVSHFRTEVRQLNRKTRDLKCEIRDRCGPLGAEWYRRWEARTRARRVRQVS